MTGADDVLLADERATLQAFVDDQRRAIAELLDGVTEEEAQRSLVPSRTTLASLVKHCTFVEKVWFQVGLAGRTRADLGLPDDVDDSFVLDDADTCASLLAAYAEACAESDAVASAYTLDDHLLHNRRSPLTVRWLYAHLIRELARHAGHGDILREQIVAARTVHE
ncbi:MAG: DinB family protein [Candidatus Nanopelagicales bacterium]